MAGIFALLVGTLCFMVPLGLPLAMRGWRPFLTLLAIAVVFFGWLTIELPNPQSLAAIIGSFLGGLMLLGFACGAIAKLTMLLGRGPNLRN